MIILEILEENKDLVKTHSDAGMKIRQDETGYLYDEAIDPVSMHRTYTETDIPVEKPEETETLIPSETEEQTA